MFKSFATDADTSRYAAPRLAVGRHTKHSICTMIYLFLLSTAVAAGWGLRRYTTPCCPRCKHREWDRRLCAPLLLCRHCSTRIDHHGRTYN